MSYIDLGPRLQEYPAPKLGEYFDLLCKAINQIDRGNFPKPLKGDDILSKWSVALNKLAWKEWPIFLCSAVPLYSTTSTTPVDIGPFFRWDPTKFPGGLWYLEATIAVANAAATATCSLKRASGVIGSVTTQSTALVRVRSAALSMPTDAVTDVWLTIQTNNASYAAIFAGARLIFVPT